MTAAIHLEELRPARAPASCPVCDEPAERTFLTRSEIAAELSARDRFYAARFPEHVLREGLRDVTDVVLGTAAAIRYCSHCGVLIREAVPGDEAFREDRYCHSELERLHQTHLRAFGAKASDYRSLLSMTARVFEVGCYAGGFLATAAEWGWRVSGADISPDTVRYCRGLGLDVRCLSFEECGLAGESLDAVFIWNCFEQIVEPASLLSEARRVMRAGGLLVIRVPDADFYIQHHQQESVAALAYNNLLGWPHRFGYSSNAVRRLAGSEGFAFVQTRRRPVIRPLREAMHPWARQEEAQMVSVGNMGWIEMTFRRR